MNTRELLLRSTIPIFINSYNQPGYLLNIITKFKNNKFKNINVIDNLSTSKPLMDLYENLAKSGVNIIYYNENRGPRYFHLSGLYKILPQMPHIYTDPDLDFDLLADDFLSKLLDLSEKYKVVKVGSALNISTQIEFKNLIFKPESPKDSQFTIREWEEQFWKTEIEIDVYAASIDTTLHLFNPNYFDHTTPGNYLSGLRVAGLGYTALHLPWLLHDPIGEKDEEHYRLTNKFGAWIN